MGNKITIDSATLMNKGLEVIEAFWLFGLPAAKIDVVIHPQSIIHSMVEFTDGSIKAQMGIPDMKIPIQYALLYPERAVSSYTKINFGTLQQMTFSHPDKERFPCLSLAYEALATGGTAPAVLNAANEVAVGLFLDERLPFAAIPSVIAEALSTHVAFPHATLDDLVRVDHEIREQVLRQHATMEH
jgi:1-deoxy-D-xylulose-5-phosphate reductoisomerase